MTIRGTALGITLLLSSAALAQTTAPATAPSAKPEKESEDKLTVTHHTMSIDGKTLGYRASAGGLTMKDDAGKPKANIFFVAYEKDDAGDAAKRPLTICFNGGPGAAAVWLHLGAAGPKTISMDANDLPVGPPFSLVDNPATWLAASDLVFIDPVSTGYSRPAPGEKADQFHGLREDVASVADFIRMYITRNKRWASPIYLAGESYGTTRAAVLAGRLADRYGIAVNGIVLVSSVLDFQALSGGPGNDMPYVLYLPSYAAVAGYHKKLSPDLAGDPDKTIESARHFAMEQYAPALAMGAALPAEKRAEILKQLAAFTGLPEELIDRANLRIDPELFEKRLLGEGREIVGRFDGRVVGYDPAAISNHPAYDPSLSRYEPAYSATFNDYIRRELNYENDLSYEVLTDVGPWNFGADRGTGGYVYVIDELQSAMLQNPKLRVMFVNGKYDLATPFFAADYAIDRMNLSPELRANISHEYFPTGHMVYHNHEAAKKLANDISAFVTSTK